MRAVYISPNQDEASAQSLGLGFIRDPSSTAHALIEGNGTSTVLPAPVTLSQVTAAEAPILAAEAAAATAQTTAVTNAATLQQRATTALANNATYLAIASPTTAQAITQVAALTRQIDGVIRLLLQQFASIADS